MRRSVLLLLLASVAPAPANARGLGDLEVIAAVEALDRGADRRALELLEELLATPLPTEQQAEARLLAARAGLRLGAADRALELLEGLEASLPEVADVVLDLRARALRAQHRWEEALPSWREIVALHPESALAADARYSIGDALYALGRYAEAEGAYEAALRVARRSWREPFTRLNLARIAEHGRRWLEAAAGYGYLAYLRPGDPASPAAAARLTALVAAGRARPPSVWQLLTRVDVLLSTRSLAEAERGLAQAAPLVTAETRAAFDYRQAKLAYRRREFDAAAGAFAELAARAGPRERLDYEQWLARTYSTAGRYADAVRVYLGIAEREGRRRDGREGLFKAGWLAYHGRDHRYALELFGRFLERYPADGAADEALWYMAWNAYHLGDLPLAQTVLVRLREEYPGSSLAQRSYYWQGRFATLLADLAGARRAYQAAIASDALSYYGVLATQRLLQLEADVAPVLFAGGFATLASGAALLPSVAASPEPPGDELPLASDVAACRHLQGPPWGAAVLDWSSEPGRRVLRLIRLGMNDLAADGVGEVPAVAGLEVTDVLYGRARMLYGLGDYNAAYRLVDLSFGELFKRGASAASRRYFRLGYPDAFADEVNTAAREFGISPLVVLAVMRQESAFDERARSGASAHGLMQIIPPTGERIAAALGVTDYDDVLLLQPEVAVRFGSWYLAQLLSKFGGNLALAVGAYNAGPAAVERWVDARPGRSLDEFVEDIPYRETRHYVKRVLGNLAVYAWLCGGKTLRLPDVVPATYLDNIDY